VSADSTLAWQFRERWPDLESAQNLSRQKLKALLAGDARSSSAKIFMQRGLDPSMGHAYAGLAVVSRNFNRPAEALNYYELALPHIGRMSEREKLRTSASSR